VEGQTLSSSTIPPPLGLFSWHAAMALRRTQGSEWGAADDAPRPPCHAAEWMPELLDWMALNGAEGVSGEGASVKVGEARATFAAFLKVFCEQAR